MAMALKLFNSSRNRFGAVSFGALGIHLIKTQAWVSAMRPSNTLLLAY
jgi:hypothetical protein